MGLGTHAEASAIVRHMRIVLHKRMYYEKATCVPVINATSASKTYFAQIETSLCNGFAHLSASVEPT